MPDAPAEDFLDAPTYSAPAYADPTETPEQPRRGLRAGLVTAAWLVAGLVLGAVGVAAVHAGHGSSTASGAPTVAGGQGFPGAGGPPAGGFGGGVAGEQHVIGTLTAVNGASLTVQTASGTSTYTIDSGTALVKDGQPVASLSAMAVGDSVVVHVYPQNGTQHVEVVFDGVPGGGLGRPDDNNGSSDGSGTVTHT